MHWHHLLLQNSLIPWTSDLSLPSHDLTCGGARGITTSSPNAPKKMVSQTSKYICESFKPQNCQGKLKTLNVCCHLGFWVLLRTILAEHFSQCHLGFKTKTGLGGLARFWFSRPRSNWPSPLRCGDVGMDMVANKRKFSQKVACL